MSRFNFLKFIAGLTAVGITTTCSGHASQDMRDSKDPGAARVVISPAVAPSPANTSDMISVQLGAYHLMIPKAYFSMGALSIQTTDHLVLDIHLPDIRPMTDEERDQFARTGLMLPSTAHVILEAGDNHIYGETLFEHLTRDGDSVVPPFHHLPPEDSGWPNMVVYHNKLFARDVYLVKGTSPKFFFDCSAPDKFVVNPDCKYYGHLIGDIRFQIWYNKKLYFNDIEVLTPKIRRLLLYFSND